MKTFNKMKHYNIEIIMMSFKINKILILTIIVLFINKIHYKTKNFQNKKICSICSSRLSNERNKQKHYFKEYYQLNREKILGKYHEEANLKPKLKQGRPKKVVEKKI